MKTIKTITFTLLSVLLIACEYDNYDAPNVTFKGNLIYNGQNYLFDGNPNLRVITLIQKGFGKTDIGTNVRIDENGGFSQLLFPGDYGLTLANNTYPFEFKEFKSLGVGLGYDTIPMRITSNVARHIEVIPYYEITNFSIDIESGNIVARFKVKKIEGTVAEAPKIIRARCFVSTSSLVNSATTLSKSVIRTINPETEVVIPVSISSGSSSYRQMYVNNFRSYAYCRVAIELKDIPNYYIFSETMKIENLPQ